MLDRRSFLLTAAAASAAPLSIIKTGILGTQHSHTEGKLAAMRGLPDYEVLRVCEPDPEARAAAEKHPMFKGLQWSSEEELLGDKSISLIAVECRPWEAIPLGRKVIAAGKHLHLEKPPGNKFPPFRELVEEARRKNLLIQLGYMWRWHEGISAAIEAAKKGWLGEVYMVRGTIKADRDAAQRALEAKYKGGTMYELGGHLIDRVVELLGRPKAVRNWLRHDSKVDDKLMDNTLAVLEYGRALAVISSASQMYSAGNHRSFEIIGSDGTFLVLPETNPPRMRVAMRKGMRPYRTGWQDIDLGPQPRYIGDFRELARALKSGTPLKHSYDHELTVHETLLRASGEI
jgi:predicted dehydrogenase